jgi:Ca2+-binding EF-hand superfamily protein
MRRDIARQARMQKHTFLTQATSFADEGNGLALENLQVPQFVDELRLSYTDQFASVTATHTAIVDDCADVAIPPPVNLTEMYPTVPFYEHTLSIINRARGGPPDPDRLANCERRLFEAIPAVCLGIDHISSQTAATWTCSKACSSQWIDGLQYCKNASIYKFHTPVTENRKAALQIKVVEWELYAALGAVSQSEPDLYGVIPDDDHNLGRQEIDAWYSRWWLDTKGEIMDLDSTLSQMTAKCMQTVSRGVELRAAALSAPPSEGPTAMVATSTISGPPVDPVAMMQQLEAQHGAGNAVIKSFRQEASMGISLPGSVSDFDASTPKGQAARYMVRQGTAIPVGVYEQNVTINGIGEKYAGRRRLQSTGGGVAVNVSIVSSEDVSSSLTNSNFSSDFSDAYIGAAATVPDEIAVSHTDLALLSSSASSINDQEVAITLPTDIASVYPDDDEAAQLTFKTTAANDLALICNVAASRITITEVVSGSAIIRFIMSDQSPIPGDTSAAAAVALLLSQVTSGGAPEVGGFALANSAVEIVSGGGVQVSEPTYTTEIEIEVVVPPGMLPDDAAELVDQNAILGLLYDAGVDLSQVTLTAEVTEVLPVVEMLIEVQVTLDVTMEQVEADRAGFEASFKTSAATELGVSEAAVTITAITAGSVVVSFTVDGLAESAVSAALTGATLAGYAVTDILAGTDLAPAVDSSDVVANTISAEELAGLGGAGETAKELAEATLDIDFAVGIGVGAGVVTLIGLYIAFFTIGRHRSKIWSQQMAQVVPTGPGAVKAKQALEDMRARLEEERKQTPPKSDTPDEEEGLGLTRTQMLLANLSQEQIQIVQETFEMFDDDKSGAIDASEMRAAMKALGQNYTKKECKEMIAELDEDGDGDLDIDEFLVLMAPMLLKMDETEGDSVMTREQLETVKAAFDKFDLDGSGEIDATELQCAMRKLGHKMTVKQCEQAIASVDEDESGEIDLNEFIVLMAPIIIEVEQEKLHAQIEAQRLEEEQKAAAIAARKRQAEQDLMDARLREGAGTYGAGSGVYGDTSFGSEDGDGTRRRKKKKKKGHSSKMRAAGDASMVASSARHRRGYDNDDEIRGAEGLPGAAPRPLPRPPKTRKHAKGMGGSRRSRMRTEKIETDKNWMLTEAEKQGLNVEEGVSNVTARLR